MWHRAVLAVKYTHSLLFYLFLDLQFTILLMSHNPVASITIGKKTGLKLE